MAETRKFLLLLCWKILFKVRIIKFNNKLLLLCLAALVHVQLSLAQPTLVWARQTGGKDYSSAPTDKGTGIVVDIKGNSYVCGNFWGSSDFDPGAGTFWLTSGGVSDVFVAKYNTAGQLVWAKRMGGQNYNDGSDIAIDKNGFIYLTGSFQGVSDFNPGMAGFNLTPSGYKNAFVSKLDTNGNMIWVKQLGGVPSSMDQIQGSAVAVDDSGNVYSAGLFGYNTGGGVDLDPGSGTFYPIGKGDFDIYISKLDKDGNFVWGRNLGSSGREFVNKIAVDQNGDLYLTGSFKNKMDFDPGPGEFFLQGNLFDTDVFICKLSRQGNLMWAKKLGGNGTDVGHDIHVDLDGNILTTGEFAGAADFDPGDSVFTLTGSSKSAFVNKLSGNGTFIWAAGFRGGLSGGYGVCSDRFRNIYFTGDVSVTPASPCDMNPGPEDFLISRAYNSPDIFICKLDSSGKFISGGTMGGPNGIVTNKGFSIAADFNENILVTGTYTGQTPDFDPNPDPFAVFYMKTSNMDDEDIFICKYGTPPTRKAVYPSAAFEATSRLICAGSCISFTDKSENAEQWDWKFTGASTSMSSLKNPSNICYLDTGLFAVSLKVVNADGADSLLISDYIRVMPAAKAGALTANNDSICYGAKLEINVSGSVGQLQWQSSADGSGFSNLNHSESLLKINAFEISTGFRVIAKEQTCADTSNVLQVKALPLPDTGFTVSGGNHNKSFEPDFDNVSGYTYLWDFGDNTGSVERGPVHLYRFPGNYRVCLQTTSADGCTASSCQEITIGNITSTGYKISKETSRFIAHLNKAQGTLTLQNTGAGNKQSLLSLFDLQGRLIKSDQLNFTEQSFHYKLPELPAGIYVIVLQSNGYSESFRFEKPGVEWLPD